MGILLNLLCVYLQNPTLEICSEQKNWMVFNFDKKFHKVLNWKLWDLPSPPLQFIVTCACATTAKCWSFVLHWIDLLIRHAISGQSNGSNFYIVLTLRGYHYIYLLISLLAHATQYKWNLDKRVLSSSTSGLSFRISNCAFRRNVWWPSSGI